MLARVDTYALPPEIYKFDLSLMLNTVAEQFDTLAEEKHMRIERAITPHLKIHGSEDQLIQVVFNLVDNAVKYSPVGSQIRICAEAHDHHVQIMIEDNGPGIPLTEQDLIFDRFYRIDQSRNRNRDGFGLGLAIAKRIIILHSGTIRVISTMGYGSQFVVTLPLN